MLLSTVSPVELTLAAKSEMNLRTIPLNCRACGQDHQIEIDFDSLSDDQRNCRSPILDNFVCDRVARMYRIMSFALDTRSGLLNKRDVGYAHENIIQGLKQQWGEHDFDKKLERFRKMELSFFGIPDEYYDLLHQIVDAYCCGQFYPAMTGAGALGERILNRLILKTRNYYRTTPEYRTIYRKKSFDQWETPIEILETWGVISHVVADAFLRLKVHRNDSIHYRDEYPFAKNAESAVFELFEVINGQFNYLKREDLFWVFTVPGEIWLRTDKEADPFVKEFVLPHCARLSAYCQPTQDRLVMGEKAPLAPLGDEEFLAARKQMML